MIQLGEQVSSLDQLKSQQILKDCEDTISELFKLPVKEVNNAVGSHSNIELVTLITSAVHDSDSVFKTLDNLPVLKGMKPTSFLRREDNGRVKIDFTIREGFIRGEFFCGDKGFYIIQHLDGTYTCVAVQDVTLL